MTNKSIITAGVDIGSTTSKAVILIDGKLASYYIGASSVNSQKTAWQVYLEALSRAEIDEKKVQYVVGTGYGRAKVEFARENVSEISCHAKGAYNLLPDVRTIIDIGGQDTKAISVESPGLIREYVMNDKCAAGTGRFLDFMARTMGMTIQEMVDMHFEEGDPAVISNMCSVFVESEVINLINEDVTLPSIVKGIHKSVVSRINTLVRKVGAEKEYVITGGVAKNRGVVDMLENILGHKFITFPENIDPQIVGALGAAVIASERVISLECIV